MFTTNLGIRGLRKPSRTNSSDRARSCLLMGLLLAFTLGFSTVSAQVVVTKETQMTDIALHYTEVQGPSIISPHGDCLTIVNDYIFSAWYAGPMADRHLHISRKKVGEDDWVDMRIAGARNNRADSHRTAAIGVCPIDGTVHVAFDHHGNKLRYIHSVAGAAFVPNSEWRASLMRPEQSNLSGHDVPQVTYPQFWNNEDGDLMLAFREHGATAGEVKVAYYNGDEWSEPKSMMNGYRVTGGNFYFYNDFYHYFGKTYFYASLQIPEGDDTRKKGVYFANIEGNTGTGNIITRDGQVVRPPLDHRREAFKLRVANPDISGQVNDRHLVVTSDGTTYAAHNSRVLRSKPGETTFSYIAGTSGTLLGVGDKVFSFTVSSGHEKISRYNPETDNWDRVYTGSGQGRNINRYYTARAHKNKIIAIIQGNGGPQRPITCVEYDTGEPDPTQSTASTYGNGGTPGTGEAWPITRGDSVRIEVENYDQNDEIVTFSDSTPDNTGERYRTDDVDITGSNDGGSGFSVGWTKPGEWLQYTVDVAQAGLYEVSLRYARAADGASEVKLSSDGRVFDSSFNATSTGGWGSYETTTMTVELEPGEQALRLRFVDGSINVNWFEVTPVAAPVITLTNFGAMAPWDTESTWSDGSAAHGAADYVVPATGNLISPNVNATFPGYSLSVEKGGRFQVRSHESENETITVGSLLFKGGSSYTAGDFAELSAGSGSNQTNVLGGTIVNSGTTRILTFDKVGGNPFNRGLKIHSRIEGDGRLQAWEGQGGQGGDTVTVTNEENVFAGTWEVAKGSSLVFSNGGAVGSADIEVSGNGSLTIEGNWYSDASLVVEDSPNTEVDLGTHLWVVSDLQFAGTLLADGNYSVAELNALATNSVFTGTGSLIVGSYVPGGPVAHWRLNEGSGTVANDSSGLGRSGNLLHGATWSSDAERDSYVSFDGDDDRIATTFTYNLSDSDDFTWAWWANRQSTGDGDQNALMVGNRYGGTGTENLEFIKLTSTKGEFRNDSNESYDYADIISSGWHHYAMVKTGTSYQWYVDGVAQGGPVTINYSEDDLLPFHIGGDDDDDTAGGKAGEHFEGFIDDVVLYDRALNAAEVGDVRNEIYGGATMTGLESWRQAYFGTTTNSGTAADNSDANGDGESNLLEFATGQDPYAVTSLMTSLNMDGERIEFPYTRSKAAMADGVSFQVLWSDTLQVGSWNSAEVTESVASEDAEVERVVAEVPRGESGARFMQLKITR